MGLFCHISFMGLHLASSGGAHRSLYTYLYIYIHIDLRFDVFLTFGAHRFVIWCLCCHISFMGFFYHTQVSVMGLCCHTSFMGLFYHTQVSLTYKRVLYISKETYKRDL